MNLFIIKNLLKGKHAADFYEQNKADLDELAFLIKTEQQEMDLRNADTARQKLCNIQSQKQDVFTNRNSNFTVQHTEGIIINLQ